MCKFEKMLDLLQWLDHLQTDDFNYCSFLVLNVIIFIMKTHLTPLNCSDKRKSQAIQKILTLYDTYTKDPYTGKGNYGLQFC